MPADSDNDASIFQWGPARPHPLSKMHTELVWEGKYDEFGRRREVDVASLSMPMQRIETVDEPRQRAAATGNLELFEKQLAGRKRDDFRNRLVWGDNKLVMASLLKEFKGKIDLIYIDPPFDVGADFTMNVPIGDGKETVGKDQSTLEMVAYRDMWGKGTDSYLHMMFERLSLMRELLSERGKIFVHCDYRVASFVRLVMDGVFGEESFRNQISWRRGHINTNTASNQFPRNHDIIFFYASPLIKYQRQFKPYSEATLKMYRFDDGDGRGPYRLQSVRTYSAESIREMRAEGRIVESGSSIQFKQYMSDKEGVTVDDFWDDITSLQGNSEERVDYSTQKPEALLERIIKASSNEGDLVADFFCGSGTTGAVAERLGRRWIMADLGRFAIHTSRKRLIELQRKLHDAGQPYRAFDVYNLGRYERQWWQQDRLKGAEDEHRRVVLEFFKAEVLSGAPSPLLHGRKGGAFCHVDGIDGLFTRVEAAAVGQAVAQAGGREVFCLAWEFEMELRQHCLALEAELGVKTKLIPIPREIMEKNRTSPPPFLEMAVLEAEVVRRPGEKRQRAAAVQDAPASKGAPERAPACGVRPSSGAFDVKLTKFLPSLAEVPSKELKALKARAVTSGFDFIDFWAVDFDWHPDRPFNHHWQDYRTRKDRSLKTVSDAGHVYEKPGKHTIGVKVVDIFGCDTSITVEVTV
ncbi:MAG TPA: site-specific DNA-methyltransferase [Verrucomicrobiota bacterium]|nr:site-specific DNA-methyltransferase [Verrucomicrobiota bacterium]HQB17150.1 site-specific DNA-methyltransferase [Verrucomicrobiota bacterium]